jgi:hypothetical protein
MARTPEDEWFAEADAGSTAGEPGDPAEDLWLTAAEPAPRSATFDPWAAATPRILVPLSLAIAFLVALLAAFGAFDGAGTPPALLIPAAPPSITVPVARTTTTKKTTTVATRSTTSPPTTTLKPGDTGLQVKALQRELAGLGYAVGAIDGNYGPTVAKAVTAFQRAHHLTPDGIVGPATLTALSP